jgi:hypothetical protein
METQAQTDMASVLSSQKSLTALQESQIDNEQDASVLAKLFFSWSPLHGDAISDKIELQDLPDVAHHVRAEISVDRFKQSEKKPRKASLGKQLAHKFLAPLIQQSLLVLLKALSQFGSVLALHRLLQ